MVFRKYEKTYRVLVPQISTKGKHFLSSPDVSKLLNGNVVITEKMDGANTGIVRRKNEFRLQKRGSLVGESEHAQFGFFKAWSMSNYEKLMKIPVNTILYGELMHTVHTIYYDELPDYFLAFAWFDCKTNRYMHWDDLTELCNDIGLHTVPYIASAKSPNKDELFDFIPKKSAYGNLPAEGVVVWNYKKQMRGKVVRAEFQKDMDNDGHWMYKPVKTNKLT